MLDLLLIRHAQSVPSPDLDRFAYPLSDQGHSDAHALIPTLTALVQNKPVRVLSSPWPRAHDTVAPFAQAHGIPVELDPRLRERHISDRWEPDFVGWTRDSWADRDLKRPGCESVREAQTRVQGLLADLTDTQGALVVGTHGQVLVALLELMVEIEPFSLWQSLGFPHVFHLSRDAQGAWRML